MVEPDSPCFMLTAISLTARLGPSEGFREFRNQIGSALCAPQETGARFDESASRRAIEHVLYALIKVVREAGGCAQGKPFLLRPLGSPELAVRCFMLTGNEDRRNPKSDEIVKRVVARLRDRGVESQEVFAERKDVDG